MPSVLLKPVIIDNVLTYTLCATDYYQQNWIRDDLLLYMMVIDVTEVGEPITIEFGDQVTKYRIRILDASGRVVSSKGTFTPKTIGKYTVKYWIDTIPVLYEMKVGPKTSIQDCYQKVYNLLGASREGTLFDGEERKNQNFSLGTYCRGTGKKLTR